MPFQYYSCTAHGALERRVKEVMIVVKKIEKYFAKHIYLNSLTHIAVGIGLGALLTNVYFNPHPVRYGIIFLALGVLGYLYAYMSKN